MDEEMTLKLEDEVIDALTVMYSDQPTFNEEKIRLIVKKVIDEVSDARRYKKVGYTDEQIQADLYYFKSQIYNLSEYDFAHFGAPWEIARSENSVSHSWQERNTLFAGIIPLSNI